MTMFACSVFSTKKRAKKEPKKNPKRGPEAIKPDLAGERKAHEVKSVIT